ncbi:MAG: hypothetical protein J7J28_04970 [Thaumarchaeota archaeon]|nr:hypothetical protein [Nitrososphaerota archaeon]
MGEEDARRLRITPRTYLPVALSIIMTWICVLLTGRAGIVFPKPIITPVEEPSPTAPPTQALSNPAPYLNTLIVIGLIAVSSIIILYIASRKPRILRILVACLAWLVSFSITTLHLLNLSLTLNPWIFNLWIPLASATATIITYLLIFREGEISMSFAASYIASGAGGVIGMSIPYWTFLVLVAAISIYDILAVYKGHLSHLTKQDAPILRGLAVEVGDLVIGLGDLFFYSLTISAIFWNLGETPAVAATVAIVAGYTIILLLLQRRRIVPGLPIPLIGALVCAFSTKFFMA